jgi:cell division protein FtsA
MFKEMFTVLDFGSSKVTVLCGTREVNKSFRLLASADCEYEGFSNGEFIDTSNLKNVINSAISEVEDQINCKIKNVYVGVPAEFCFSYCNELITVFNKKTKITTKIIDNLFYSDKEVNPYPTHTVINKAPLFYVLNDDNKTNDPLGQIANKIKVKVSYILVENTFKTLVAGILEDLGIKTFDFISNSLSEAIYLIDEGKRNEGAFIVDCGFISSSIAQVMGDGLKELKSFSMGGAFITSDISKVFNLSYDEAEEIKRQAIVTLRPTGLDYYLTSTGKKISIKAANEVILSRVDKIVEIIKSCIDGFEVSLPNYIPLYITGGGLNYIEGISDYLRHEFDRPIELVSPKALLYRKPDLSHSIGLLNMVINLFK